MKNKKKKVKTLAQLKTVRNRIKEHRIVRAGDLVDHQLNFRQHPKEQLDALAGILDDVGFARSLLAFELPDKRLKLIDGHGRKALDPDMMVTVEILDVTEEEAEKLLASIDPLSGLATTDSKTLKSLLRRVNTDNVALTGMWDGLAKANKINSDDLELQVSGDDEDVLPEDLDLDTSHVRMKSLFLDIETLPKFDKYEQFLRRKLNTDNYTDTVMVALKKLYLMYKKEKVK